MRINELFECFVRAQEKGVESGLCWSLSASPRLSDFLGDLDPELSLDWSGESFPGLPSLRSKVVQRMGFAPECDADDVLLTAGTAEANFLTITHLVRPGDEMVVDIPGWPQPLVLGSAIGAVVKKLPRREAEDWRFRIADLEASISPRTKLIFICNPNNPSGHVAHEEELSRVCELADHVGAHVLCDEVYAGLEWTGPPTPRVCKLYERGVSTGSVSKSLGLQGLRIGWLVSRDRDLTRSAMALRENTSEVANVLGEAVADLALERERFAAAMEVARQEGRAKLDVLHRFIESTPGLNWRRPQAGLIGLCRVEASISADRVASTLLEPPFRTLVIPGSAYGLPNHLRLGVGGGDATMLSRGLAHLGQVLDSGGIE